MSERTGWDYAKRMIFFALNLAHVAICGAYAHVAQKHSHVIYKNPDELLYPYSGNDLSWEKVGYGAAIGRTVWGCLIAIPTILPSDGDWLVSEFCLFMLGWIDMAFSIVLGQVAQSCFSSDIFTTWSRSVCEGGTTSGLSQTAANFYVEFASVTGQSDNQVCRSFSHETSLLVAVLVLAIWVVLVLLIAFGLSVFCFGSSRKNAAMDFVDMIRSMF